MKLILTIVILSFLATCNHQNVQNQNDSVDRTITQKIQHSERELVSFLDSIGKLKPNSWSKTISAKVDSTLKNQDILNTKLNALDFEQLKITVNNGEIDLDLAKRIFPKIEDDSNLIDKLENNKLQLQLYSFDEKVNDFNEFAISIGYNDGLAGTNDVYFFKSDRVIARHEIVHRYGLELNHFKNESDETIFYYKLNFESGSGIWWHQFNFYRYDNERLVPTLTAIENSNLQYPWGLRSYWIKSTLLGTTPLKLKYVFNNQFADSLGNHIDFINDSTEVTYTFDTIKKVYEPNFKNVKLNKPKLLTYYQAPNELLFVNSNQDLFKMELNGKDKARRTAVLIYLNELKNALDKE